MISLRSAIRRLARDHRTLLSALVSAMAFHGTLLAAGTFRRTYDAYVHIFFADHYARGWFATWEPRWYTGFSVTSYPPGTHQLVALGSRVLGLEAAFVLVQLAGILTLVVGVYRFTLLFGSRRAAGYAAFLAVLSTSIAEAVHVFGQLPTVCALGLLLNSLPFVRRWTLDGGRRSLAAALSMLAGTTAMHHVTTLFGAVFFIGPVVVWSLLDRLRQPHPKEGPGRAARVTRATIVPLVARRIRRVYRSVGRVAVLGMASVVVLLLVVWPYWVWSTTDPIAQVPIPHGSRESFLEDLNAGLVFWLIPWASVFLAVPYAVVRGLRSHTWPVLVSILALAFLGTGGTTPLPRLLLGEAFEILTLDRFTFWATILILPFAGAMAADLVDGPLAKRLVDAVGRSTLHVLQAAGVLALVGGAAFTVNLTQFRKMQPAPIAPAPIVSFLEKDQHWRWRYLTLGFGDQMAWLSTQTSAQSVDGNYHSARRLPELTSTPVERLEGAKFRGVPGLGSLQQFLGMPERYHLKYVFSNDQFYDPLLQFSGWRMLQTLENGVVVWEREDVPPLPGATVEPELPTVYRVMWGILPLAAILAAALGAVSSFGPGDGGLKVERWARLDGALGRLADRMPAETGTTRSWKDPFRLLSRRFALPDSAIKMTLVTTVVGLVTSLVVMALPAAHSPAAVVVAYYDDVDFKRFEQAWTRLDEESRPSLDEYLLQLSVEDGLVDSYASLDSIGIVDERIAGTRAQVTVDLVYVTALAEFRVEERVDLIRGDGTWGVVLPPVDPTEPVERLARRAEIEFVPQGRRSVTTANTEYDDVLDRPELEVSQLRLVLRDGRPALLGMVENIDVDPASLTVTGALLDERAELLATYNATHVVEHSLLPGESTPFLIEFEGVAGRDTGDFQAAAFTPIDLAGEVAAAHLYAASVVTGRGLSRPVTVQRLTVTMSGSAPVLDGELLNLGPKDVTVTALLVSLYDASGTLVWVDWVIVPEAVKPGRSVSFHSALTGSGRLVTHDVDFGLNVNGLFAPVRQAAVPAGAVPAPAGSGYRWIAVQPVVFERATR